MTHVNLDMRDHYDDLVDKAAGWCSELYYANDRPYYCREPKNHPEAAHSCPAEIRESEGRSLR